MVLCQDHPHQRQNQFTHLSPQVHQLHIQVGGHDDCDSVLRPCGRRGTLGDLPVLTGLVL